MSREKIFILGVGGEKCGTTWLYTQLNRSEKFSSGKMGKEWNVFNWNWYLSTYHRKTVSKQLRSSFNHYQSIEELNNIFEGIHMLHLIL